MIYLDHAATTPLSPAALAEWTRVAQDTIGNPSSIHHFGRKANQVLRQARQDIAQLLEVVPDRILFTSGGSEANSLAIVGYALANQEKGKHLITTAIEHHSVLHSMAYLEERFDFEITYLQPDKDGQITPQALQAALRDDTILVSIMFANNETGHLLPIQEMGQVLADHPACFHVDAVQAMGKFPIYPEKWGIDFLSASAHKFHGPRGVGFLYSRVHQIDSLIHGGKQEKGHRAGTENLPAIAAMACALKEQVSHWQDKHCHVEGLFQHLVDKLSTLPHYLNRVEPSLPHVLNIGFPGQLNEQLLMKLDLAGIAVSSGSACTAGIIQKSHVLTALYGENSHRLTESIRISLSEQTSLEEIDTLTTTLHTIIGDSNGI